MSTLGNRNYKQKLQQRRKRPGNRWYSRIQRNRFKIYGSFVQRNKTKFKIASVNRETMRSSSIFEKELHGTSKNEY